LKFGNFDQTVMGHLAGTVFDAISRSFEQSNWDRVTQRDKGCINVRLFDLITILASCNLQYTQYNDKNKAIISRSLAFRLFLIFDMMKIMDLRSFRSFQQPFSVAHVLHARMRLNNASMTKVETWSVISIVKCISIRDGARCIWRYLRVSRVGREAWGERRLLKNVNYRLEDLRAASQRSGL